jgi:ferric-dicitrate binding protein FerR (iron transport regulator)
MIVLLPSSFAAQSTDRALLHSDGGTWLNGNPAPDTSAIFPDNLIQTQKAHTATIDAEGSTVTVQPETIVQFEGDELVLDHGSLQLNTARQMKVRVNCITVIPVTAERTQYDVTDFDGKVKVVAYKNDVQIHYAGAALLKSKQAGSSDLVVREGEQATRDEHCGAPIKPTEGLDAEGAILNSPWAKGAGLAIVGVLTCWALCRGDDPVSPSKP